MYFLKIKYKSGSRVELKYEQENPAGEMDEYQLKCADKPSREFEQALQALAAFIPEICEFQDDHKHYTISSVSFSWAEGVMGATITALKALQKSNSPLVINTPHKTERPDSKTGAACLSEEAINGLIELQHQAARYIEGHRAQMNLFTGLAAA